MAQIFYIKLYRRKHTGVRFARAAAGRRQRCGGDGTSDDSDGRDDGDGGGRRDGDGDDGGGGSGGGDGDGDDG